MKQAKKLPIQKSKQIIEAVINNHLLKENSQQENEIRDMLQPVLTYYSIDLTITPEQNGKYSLEAVVFNVINSGLVAAQFFRVLDAKSIIATLEKADIKSLTLVSGYCKIEKTTLSLSIRHLEKLVRKMTTRQNIDLEYLATLLI